MMQDDKTGKLFTEFPPVSTPEWEQVIQKDLKGADYAKKLIWTSPAGIQVKPYYRSEDLDQLVNSEFNPMKFSFDRSNPGQGNSWLIRQDIRVADPLQAGERALYLISMGVQAIGFLFEEPLTAEEVSQLLKDLPLEEVEFSFEGSEPAQILAVLREMAASGKVDPLKIKGSCEWDMLGDFSLYGSF